MTKRGQHYGLVPSDKITIFKKPIEAKCGQCDTEIARPFGISGERLEQIEKGQDQ